MESYQELFDLARRLREGAITGQSEDLTKPIEAVKKAVETVGRASSGSWLGYHANVYYADLRSAPLGAHFSQEWGLEELLSNLGSRGDWHEYDSTEVEAQVYQLAGSPDLDAITRLAQANAELFQSAKSDATSILSNEPDDRQDKFLDRLKQELETLKPITLNDVIHEIRPGGQLVTRDITALGQGYRTPPHLLPWARVVALGHNIGLCKNAADILAKAASHLERRQKRLTIAKRIGTNVFIGHGRSASWRELKDFIQDRAGLPWDEFNRVPVAGITNIARLSEMLDAAAIAFLLMTGEDEMADGGVQARMNVVHEAGLFQGRLGFTRAILLLEEACSEFSNIQGLGQIRFPKGRIDAAFEEIRRVLERESLLPG